jgi:uncharacterized protein YcfL
MRVVLALTLAAAILPGCKPREETTRVGRTQDTVVTTKQTQDTMLVSHDTTVTVDTNVKRGERTTRVDTVKKTAGATQATRADTSRPR